MVKNTLIVTQMDGTMTLNLLYLELKKTNYLVSK